MSNDIEEDITNAPGTVTRIKVITPDGAIKHSDRTDLTFRRLQDIVGGYIEVYPIEDGNIILLNEDGRSLDLPINYVATKVLERHLHIPDGVRGTAVVMKGEEFGRLPYGGLVSKTPYEG